MTKSFFGNTVLADVDLTLHAGQVHGLVGENGAGKSTLMKMLAGVHTPDRGEIVVAGEQVSFGHPVQAQRAGVSTVFQEFNLLLERTIAENIWLGREPRRFGAVGPVDTAPDAARHRRAARRPRRAAASVPATLVRSLSVAEQQVVEIAEGRELRRAGDLRWTSRPPRSPTTRSSCSTRSSERLTDRGVAILYVSHRLKRGLRAARRRSPCSRTAGSVDPRSRPRSSPRASSSGCMVGTVDRRRIFPDSRTRHRGRRRTPGARTASATATSTIVTLDAPRRRDRRSRRPAGLGPHRAARDRLRRPPVHPRRTRASTAPRPRVDQPAPAAYAPASRSSPRTARPKGLALNQSILDNALGVVRSVFPRRTDEALPPRRCPGVLSNARRRRARPRPGGAVPAPAATSRRSCSPRWLSIDPLVVLMDEPTRGIDVGAKHARLRAHARACRRQASPMLMVSERAPRGDRHVRPHPGDARRHASPASCLPGSTEEQVLVAGHRPDLTEDVA